MPVSEPKLDCHANYKMTNRSRDRSPSALLQPEGNAGAISLTLITRAFHAAAIEPQKYPVNQYKKLDWLEIIITSHALDT